MSELGFRRFADMVGQVERLQAAELSSDWQHWKARHLDLSALLYKPEPAPRDGALHWVQAQDHALSTQLDHELLRGAAPALLDGTAVHLRLPVRNTDRSVGAMLAGRVAERYGHAGLPAELIRCDFAGSAGQSFGCFLTRGISFFLAGEANDYVGKGLSGGRIALFPPPFATFRAEENIIAGNVIGYGATAGELYLRGVVGERFCVRNSGADAVVEGVGDHGCEYMTGGRVVVLGSTGRNFAAGMSGGIAYVLDGDGRFRERCNTSGVSVEPLRRDEDHKALRELLERHVKYTGSLLGTALLADFSRAVQRFVAILPQDPHHVLLRCATPLPVERQATAG
jgi:glutamate synthase domain-containing protein 3